MCWMEPPLTHAENQQLSSMNFEDTYYSSEYEYSIGVESTLGRHYASIPVSNGIVDYEEYYELTRDQYLEFCKTQVRQSNSSKRVVGGSTMICSCRDRAITAGRQSKTSARQLLASVEQIRRAQHALDLHLDDHSPRIGPWVAIALRVAQLGVTHGVGIVVDLGPAFE